MSFDSEKIKFGRELIHVVEIDLDYCAESYGTSPCTAGRWLIETSAVADNDFGVGDTIKDGTTNAEGILLSVEEASGGPPNLAFGYQTTNGIQFSSGSATITNITAGKTGSATKDTNAPVFQSTGNEKCENTFVSCEDRFNFNNSTPKTFRLYENRSPAPLNISNGLDVDAIPCISENGVRTVPQTIAVGGGLGERANVSVSFKDLPHSDIGIDKYVSERSYDPSERGSFWTKLRARNPNYENRPMRVLSGYLTEDGEFDASNFETRHYYLDKMNVTRGGAQIIAKDPLKLVMSKKAQVPKPSNGELASGISAVDGSATLSPTGIGSEYPSSGKVLIDKEIMSFTRSGDTLTITRGQNNTVAEAHNSSATVQLCYEQTGANVDVIVKDILENYANVPSSFIPAAIWQSEVQDNVNYGLN